MRFPAPLVTVFVAGLALRADAADLPKVEMRGAPGHWTLNGHEVPDQALDVLLRDLYMTRSDKRIFFDTGAGVPYGKAVEVLDLVAGQGADQLVLMPEGGRVEDGILVQLAMVAGRTNDPRLPSCNLHCRERGPADVELSLGPAGLAPAELEHAVSNAAAARILLRADAGATYGHVFKALQQAKARGARALGLAVQKRVY